MFIELLNEQLLNMFLLQGVGIDSSNDKLLIYYLTNGSTIIEDCGDSQSALERQTTVKSIMTGHLEELKTQVTQLEATVTTSSIELDKINGEVV